MMKIRATFCALLLVLCGFADAGDVYTDGYSVTVTTDATVAGSARKVRLTVVGDNIMRVEASPTDNIAQTHSLMVVPQQDATGVTTREDTQYVYLWSQNMSARIDRKTGAVTFFNKQGVALLQEANNGKIFRKYISSQDSLPLGYRASAPGELNWNAPQGGNVIADKDRTGYSWQAVFDSPADECFYGLGQHQSEEYNYKGKNEELFQYNTKVSVPFVVSNRNYGLLWDSYSLCRWGNPYDYRQLGKVFTLYDKNGATGALTGVYTDSKGNKLERREDSLYFENSSVIGNLPKGFRLDGANVVYEGFVQPSVTQTYHFVLYYAGYIKVFIDGKEVVAERWRTAWNPNAYKFSLPLEAGHKAALRIEWRPDGGVSYCGLRVADPKGEMSDGRISVWSEMSPKMDYYFIAGSNMDEVISGYRTLTGKAPIMPKWAMGFWQSRERYKTAAEVTGTLREFRQRHIPIDNIVQDWNYWKDDAWGSHRFDSIRYPDPQAMLDSVHALHGRFMISVWPKFYCNTANFKELDAHGWIYRQAVKDSLHDWLGYMGSFYDAYSSGAREMFWRQLNDSMYTKYKYGVDAWWMDASEPNVRDCTPIGYRKQLCGPTALGSSDEYFNAYALMNAEAIYDGQRAANADKRVFLLTRSGFAGLQRYSTATWSGDIGTRWEDMRAQMTAGLNFSMSGIPFWGMDQGGFCVEKRYDAAERLYERTGEENEDLKEWRELQTRWNQFGCFIPLYRTHGQWPLREVWNIAPETHPAYKSIVFYDRLRYRLMPYLYSMAGWVHTSDYTILRGLVMDFANDRDVENIGNQWMFGPSLMACPVATYKARSRMVYFPKQCGWYDLYSGRHIKGGQRLNVDAPYERIPVFVREGAIVPFGPALEWSDEKQPELINLYVYTGADGQFTLYEDEGTNYNYEKGDFTTIDIVYKDATHSVTIGQRSGKFNAMLQKRRFNIVAVSAGKAVALDLDHPKGVMVNYDGKEVVVKIGKKR
jgi:alpha-D-xyloside xylohydrolase